MSYASPWEGAPRPALSRDAKADLPELTPAELLHLRERVQELPPALRVKLEPYIDDAVEQAAFRARVLVVARDAMARMRLDLELTKFDLEVTRKERDGLKVGSC
jgi:hypothetical protein